MVVLLQFSDIIKVKIVFFGNLSVKNDITGIFEEVKVKMVI